MIQGLDCVSLRVASPADAVATYASLLGQGPLVPPGRTTLQVANARVEFVARNAGTDEGLAGLAFAVDDLAKAKHLLERRAMRVLLADADRPGSGPLHVATDSTHGVPISLIEGAPKAVATVSASGAAAVSGLDHIVIRTPDPERSVGLYAGRLGLSLRLDRSEPSWGARLLFFRCGDLVIEVAHDLKAGAGDGPDTLWGLSWRVPDIAAAHARLENAGVGVSEIRLGRRPGTKVFTVRGHTCGVPTIMVGPATSPAT